MMKKGLFCFSIDLELLWGKLDLKNYTSFIEKSKKERGIINRILVLARKYKIPITWATVGHLFLNNCHARDGIKHPEITRCNFPWFKEDWFCYDPATNLKKDPLWYGNDIIENIRRYKIHDVGSHSFSHVRFGDFFCTRERAECELRESVKYAKKIGIDLKAFVFPHDSVGHLKVLKRNGIEVYRGESPKKYFKSKKLSKFVQILELFGILPSSVFEPSVVEKLVNIPSSMYFVSARGLRKFIPKNIRFYQAKRGINEAINQKKIFHLWTHTIDFADKTDVLFDDLENIFKYVDEKRREGILEAKTMKEIAIEFRKNSKI